MTPSERLAALNRVLKHCRAAPFYRDRIPEKPLTSLSGLKRIPLTTKEDLRRASPFGLICIPRNEICQYHESFGTTGVPVSVWFSKDDLKDFAGQLTKWGVNFNQNDTVLVRFPYAISGIAHGTHTAAQLKNACVIAASSRSTVSPFPRVVDLMRKLQVTLLAGLPLQALLIAETAELLGYKPDRDFPHLRAIGTGGEPLFSGRKKMLEGIWGVPVFDHYGMTEIGAAVLDCEFGQPHPLEDDYIFELLDKDTKTDVKPGQVGYLVVTTLKRRATPIIRYLTGDRARVVERKCPCRKDMSLEIRGRREDTIAVGSRLLDLWDLQEIVSHLPCRRFWVVGPDSDGLRFIVEEEKTGDSVSTDRIRKLEEMCQLRLEVEIVPKGTLYDRSELLALGEVGKPRYIYSAEEVRKKAYLKSARV